MPVTRHTIHHELDGNVIVASVARSQNKQTRTGVSVSVQDMPIVGQVVAITIVCPEGAMMVALNEDQAAAFAIQFTAAQLTHAQANDRSVV
jgi:hypothetical protein